MGPWPWLGLSRRLAPSDCRLDIDINWDWTEPSGPAVACQEAYRSQDGLYWLDFAMQAVWRSFFFFSFFFFWPWRGGPGVVSVAFGSTRCQGFVRFLPCMPIRSRSSLLWPRRGLSASAGRRRNNTHAYMYIHVLHWIFSRQDTTPRCCKGRTGLDPSPTWCAL